MCKFKKEKIMKDSISIKEKIFQGTIIIILVGILAKFSAFVSGTVLAAFFGTTYQSDSYYMVSSIKDLIYPMLSVGIWKVFLPLYKENLAQNSLQKADILANKAISFFTLVSVIAVLLMIAFASQIVSIVAPGFEGETKELCIRLLRISAPANVVIIASAVYASMLQCHNKFLGSQIREVVSHIPTILTAVFFYSTFGIEAMAFALIIDGLLRLIIEIPFVDWGYKFEPDFNFKSKQFMLMLKRLPSALVSEGVNRLNVLIDKAMASMLPIGAISGLSYGQRLMNVFSGLLSSAVATALYPQMIELIALYKLNELANLVAKIINVFCIMMFPVTIGCILFRNEIVSVAFERGIFDNNSVALTSSIFALYILGVFFIACNTVITNLFYGFGNTRTPMLISIINLVINVILNLLFVYFWGVNGLALATSVAAFLTFFVRLKLVENYIKIDRRIIMITGTKVFISSIIACGIPRLLFNYYPINKFLLLVLSALMGMLTYFVIMKILRVPEMEYVVELLFRKFKNR